MFIATLAVVFAISGITWLISDLGGGNSRANQLQVSLICISLLFGPGKDSYLFSPATELTVLGISALLGIYSVGMLKLNGRSWADGNGKLKAHEIRYPFARATQAIRAGWLEWRSQRASTR